MSSTLSKVIMFVAGAAVGSLVTWKIAKDKYKKIADKEISDVIKKFSADKNGSDTVESTEDTKEKDIVNTDNLKTTEQEDFNNYKNLLRSSGYSDDSDKGGNEMPRRPYVIPPEEYDEEGYDTLTLMYYMDDETIIDERENVLDEDDICDLVGGREVLEHFGEYEDDSVFVRNDRKKLDIEILSIDGGYPFHRGYIK